MKYQNKEIKICPVCKIILLKNNLKTCSKSCAMISRWKNLNALWRNKEWLEKQYFQNNLSFASMGKIAGCTDKTVQHFFKKFNLKPRYTGRTDGQYSPNWKGGKIHDLHGYTLIFHPKPHAYKGKNQKYVREHILVMEKILDRKLRPPEVIHHKNGIPSDNRPENLQLMPSPLEHNTYEQKLGLFAKKILFDDFMPHLKQELLLNFQKFLSLSVKER